MTEALQTVSDVYVPEDDTHRINDEPIGPHYEEWGYSIGYETDANGNAVPEKGNTAVFRIAPHGLTEPQYVTKPEVNATFTVCVLSGDGECIRATADGTVERLILHAGTELVIRPGEAYSYVNTGQTDLLLHDVALPAFKKGDDVETSVSLIPDERPNPREGYAAFVTETANGPLTVELPKEFFDAMAGAMNNGITEKGFEKAIDIKTREAKEDDIEALRPILEQWVIDGETKEAIHEEIDGILAAIEQSVRGENDKHYAVAENEEGEVIGVMGICPASPEMQNYAHTDKPAELINAFVDETARGSGAGRLLVAKLEAFAIQCGYKEIIVNSGPRYKEKGWPFWRKVYGEHIALRENLYGEGRHAPVWRKDLE